jgi:SAM-dependent methyltransferase
VSNARAWKQEAHTLFEYEAEHYAKLREQQSGFRAQLTIVIRMLGGERGRLLDIGCAAGSEISDLRRMGFHVVGIDFSPSMLRYAVQRFGGDPDVQFCQGDAEFLPFRSASFDHVICLGVLEYLPDYRPTIAQISRLLRPGGLAVFSIPNRVSPYYLTEEILEGLLGPTWRALKGLASIRPPAGQTPRHSRNLCIPWRLRHLTREFGLAPVQSVFSNFFVYPLERLSPAAHDRTAGFLERFGSRPLIAWTGSQYLLSARKA